MNLRIPAIHGRLEKSGGLVLTVYAILTAFTVYSCMYMFRKAYAATGYAGAPEMFGLNFKDAMVISQIIGYALSKFIGIKVVSEMGKNSRGIAIAGIIGLAWLSLLGFALAPVEYKFIFMFFNGLPLGMVWGLVFSYLEGRKFTEPMGVGLCASFIFASGFAKSTGKFLLVDMQVPEFWMPFAVGAIAFPLLLLVVFLLDQLPEPNKEDVELRTERAPMNSKQRKDFFGKFAPGLVLLVLVYTVLTAFRDFRDSFQNEILAPLGFKDTPEIFTQTETPVTIAVLVLLGFIMLIKNNRTALLVNHIVIFVGFGIAGASTLAFQMGLIGPIPWFMLTGFATYAAYIPFNALLFERLIAAFKYVSNAGFLIYVADSFGYLGVVGILFYKNFGQDDMSRYEFFVQMNYWVMAIGCIGTLLALLYFRKKHIPAQPHSVITDPTTV